MTATFRGGLFSAGVSTACIVASLAGQAAGQATYPARGGSIEPSRHDIRQPVQPAGYAQRMYLPQPQQVDEDPAVPSPVPVAQLVRYALINNPEIQAARHRARSLAARVPQAASLPDPMFMSEVMFMGDMRPVTIGIKQQFPWFGKRALRSEVAHYDAMAAYSRVMTAELEVAEAVKRAYYDLYYVERSAEETRQIERLLEDVIEVTERRYQTGVGPTGLQDVLQIRNELSKLRITLVQLEQSRRQALARLLAALHLPQSATLATEQNVDHARLAHRAEALIALVDQLQPELEAWRREAARDRTAIAVAQREYWPDVTVAVMGSELGSTPSGGMGEGRDALTLGVEMNLPIYRARLDAAVREAQCQAAATSRRYAATQDQFYADVQSYYAEFTEHDEVLTILQEEIVPRSAETFELVTEAYRAGRAEFQQLLDTYRTLLQYRIDLHRREASREQAVAALERAVGGVITAPSE